MKIRKGNKRNNQRLIRKRKKRLKRKKQFLINLIWKNWKINFLKIKRSENSNDTDYKDIYSQTNKVW